MADLLVGVAVKGEKCTRCKKPAAVKIEDMRDGSVLLVCVDCTRYLIDKLGDNAHAKNATRNRR